jgi:hypothetical protein
MIAEVKDQISNDRKEAQVVEKFLKLAEMDKSWMGLTKWLGYKKPPCENAQTLF